MHVSALWRYPVKSMGGEPLQAGELTAGGVTGDRVLLVSDARGRVVTSRSRPLLLTHKGSIGPDGEARVDGRAWTAPDVAADVVQAAGPGTTLVSTEGLRRFDVLPLLVATDGALAALGVDPRRIRPNLIIGGVEGLAERTWEGRYLKIGDAVVEAVSLRQRCVMTTFDPDTAEQDVEVLLGIHRDFDGVFALDSRVLEPGRIHVGMDVTLL